MYLSNIVSFAAVLALVSASPLRHQMRSEVDTDNTKQCPDFCAGTNFNATLEHTYVCGDYRLGPKRYPDGIPLGTLVAEYSPFGGLCPAAYLAKWYNATAGSYIYPPDDGFQLTTTGAPIEGTITFPVGFLMDRFGSEYGSFVSPQGAPYMQRALPPSNLDTPAGGAYPYNYHVYKVVKSFNALSGPIAGWFGQPGQGVQYELSTNIMGLINGGFIVRVDLS